ncbi:MAG: prepilin peptidase [Planctomycetes bacterium]|nr:prepilin peptidase [Planctomycetota bacterium]
MIESELRRGEDDGMSWWEILQHEAVIRRVMLAVLGAILGSFASAAIYRIPREGLSIWRPVRSFCPVCNSSIAWRDNLPIVSYLILRGRCRSCKVKYSAGYMVHELVLAALCVLAGETWLVHQQDGPLALGFALIALTALWIATAIDWEHLILPDGITVGGIPFGIAAAFLVPSFHLGVDLDHLPWGVSWLGISFEDPTAKIVFVSAILGSSISWALLIGIRVLFSYILRQEALGLGDVKYLTAIGAFLGLEGAVWTLLIGVFAGAVLGLLNIVRMIWVVAQRRRQRGRTRVLKNSVYMGWLLGRLFPFGPPLVLGTVLYLLCPEDIRVFFLETWPNLLLPPAEL